MADCLLDTNVVLRLIDRNDPTHDTCRKAVEVLIRRGDRPCLAPQVLVEFWVVATRPAGSNGFGWNGDFAAAAIGRLRSHLTLLADPATLFDTWLNLVAAKDVKGKHAHDARLVAFMNDHGIPVVVTLNPADFVSLGARVVQPRDLVAGAA
jgi:predicted nucleic acid-binding protein